jgi:hypothetical protein
MWRAMLVVLAGLVVLSLASAAAAQSKRELMQDAHALVFDHTTVTRSVEQLPNGVRTRTTTSNPDLLPILRRHPREMSALYREGGMVRAWDPVFRELAEVSDRVQMEVRDIDGGVEVLLTSGEAEVVSLIQAHADKVTAMVQRGAEAMREATPLPEDYARPAGNAEATPALPEDAAAPGERADAAPEAREAKPGPGRCCQGPGCCGTRGARGRRP